jgi:hypothetical protein
VPDVLRSTSADPDATQFYRVEETQALLTSVPLAILAIDDHASSTAQVFDETLHCSPLQLTPLLNA